eukprot:TRINITY_DN3837_c0_g1_i11.p1 TRINITY_DN3837_c0_g1~~TRINITY_DN3837_c0_g1_i11.p1  ORF type:complete len:373 (-),score=76.80 TRINITY_DN3837_c0_g1_i11:712-1830(-)
MCIRDSACHNWDVFKVIMKMKVKLCIGIFVALFAAFFYFLYNIFGYFRNDVYISMERCKYIPTPHGPKDLQLFNNHIISAYNDRVQHKEPSGILALSLELGEASLLELKDFPKDRVFNPHGTHMVHDTLYVINIDNKTKHDYVECFNISKGEKIEAKYWRSIRFEKAYYNQLNGVYFVNSTLFYVTALRMHSGAEPLNIVKGFKQFIRKSTHLLKCDIVDGVAACKRQDYGNMLNGISGKGRELFVVDSGANTINRYVVFHNYTLKRLEVIKLDISPESISYSEARNRFYVSVLRLRDYFSAREFLLKETPPNIPGGVLELFFEKGEWKSKLLFMQRELSGLSAAVRVNNSLVLGSWLDNKVLVCRIRKELV